MSTLVTISSTALNKRRTPRYRRRVDRRRGIRLLLAMVVRITPAVKCLASSDSKILPQVKVKRKKKDLWRLQKLPKRFRKVTIRMQDRSQPDKITRLYFNAKKYRDSTRANKRLRWREMHPPAPNPPSPPPAPVPGRSTFDPVYAIATRDWSADDAACLICLAPLSRGNHGIGICQASRGRGRGRWMGRGGTRGRR
jgi:hypothetical protein